MKLEQFHNLINKLVMLDYHGRLSDKELFKINEIIKYHGIFDYDVETLHFIADALIPRELKKIGVIMLNHNIILPCNICEGPIRKPNHLEIDHWIPQSRDGSNFMPNIGFAHKRCNHIKSNILCANEKGEMDRNGREFLQIMISVRYTEETFNSKFHGRRHKNPRTRPSGKCGHACSFNTQKTYYNNSVRSAKNGRPR